MADDSWSDDGGASDPGTATEQRSSDQDTVLLVGAPDRDRELLAEWLRGVPRYDVIVRGPDDGPLPEYDVALVDAGVVGARRPELRARREAADPLYLPHVAIGGDETAADTELVDDVVQTPISQDDLGRRLENLLRARRTSLRLSQVRDQYEQLVALTPETILVVRDGTIRYVNDAGPSLFGVESADDLVGRAVTELVHPDDERAMQTALATVERDGRLEEFLELELLTPDGESRVVEAAGVTVTYEGEPAAQFVVRDLSEQRERRRQLTLMSRAVESASQGITVADAQQDDEPLVYANEAFERLTGYDRQSILGRNCRFLQGEGTDPETVARVRRAVDEERPVSVELLNYRADGTPFWNQLDIVPIRDDDGSVTHYLGLQTDVTERKTREERLSVLDRVLRHNIRNRTNVIAGTAELLLEGLAEPEDGDGADEDTGTGADESAASATLGFDDETALERIVDAARELEVISEQAREFQAIVGDDAVETVDRDIQSVFERLTETLADEPGRLALHAPDGSFVVRCHPKLATALAAGVESVHRSDPTGMDLSVELSRRDDRVILDIVDRGNSIPEADLEAIAAERETPIEHSRGLELWIVRWTVLASDGDVSVRLDGDSPSLHITLPAADGQTDDGVAAVADDGTEVDDGVTAVADDGADADTETDDGSDTGAGS
ncbi:PAS domain-containing protein [Halobaculum sp. MBLA0147]|uniref:PAS domain-containing protein n=1 Tax=Halobaculum sp. MBLA0147 TaxID=3079934 RepID=UPI0035264482